jgi:aminoglycoside phosphotransferase (APT) family kinase protein
VRVEPSPAEGSAAAVIQFLLGAGLLSQDELLAGPVHVADMARRNSNFAVSTDAGGFFVKRARDEDCRITIAREHASLRRLHETGAADLRRVVPKSILHEPQAGWLVSELVRGGESLAVRARKRTVCAAALEGVGRGLAALHLQPVGDGEGLRTSAPSVLSYTAPSVQDYLTFSAATRVFVGAVQGSPSYAEALRQTLADWRPEALIHGDLRWENVVIGARARRQRLGERRDGPERPARHGWLVDWEFLQCGDPRWDLACFVADALWCWLTSIPTLDDDPPDPGKARVPIARMRRTVGLFWSAYWRARGGEPSPELYESVSRMAALRLLRRFFDRSLYQRALDRQSVLGLQLAENILGKPQLAVDLLWGEG